MPTTQPGPRNGGDGDEAAAANHALIDDLVAAGHVDAPGVEAAFRAAPRHHFLPGIALEQVYRDAPIPTRHAGGVPISSSSQPAAMAIMLAQLDVRPGDRVLEIGAGTGYNAALLAHLAGPCGRVVTVDLDQEIVDEARAHLDAAGYPQVQTVRADGTGGYPPAAPYDRIELTVGAWDISPAWWSQLAPGGRLLVPLWIRGEQVTVALEPAVDDAGRAHLASVNVSGCSFMRLRGDQAGPEAYVAVLVSERGGSVTLGVEDRSRVDPEALSRILDGPAFDISAGAPATPACSLWLALHEPAYTTLMDDGANPLLDISGRFLHVDGRFRWTAGAVDDASICLLLRPEDNAANTPAQIRCYGANADAARALGERLRGHLDAWHAAQQPTLDRIGLRVYPIDATPVPTPAVAIPKRWHLLALDWA